MKRHLLFDWIDISQPDNTIFLLLIIVFVYVHFYSLFSIMISYYNNAWVLISC